MYDSIVLHTVFKLKNALTLISHICPSAPNGWIFTNRGTFRDLIRANFRDYRQRALNFTGGGRY